METNEDFFFHLFLLLNSSLRKALVGKLIYFQSGKIIFLRGCFESIESYCSLFLSVQPGLVLSQLAFEECFGQSARFATWDYTNSRDLDLTCEYSMQNIFFMLLNFEQLFNNNQLILSPNSKFSLLKRKAVVSSWNNILCNLELSIVANISLKR